MKIIEHIRVSRKRHKVTIKVYFNEWERVLPDGRTAYVTTPGHEEHDSDGIIVRPNERQCSNCGHSYETKQQHPFGSTTATEFLPECAVDADDPGDNPCPSWRHYQEVEEEKANA